MKASQIIMLVVALIVVFIGVLFTLQNGGRMSDLSLSFGFAGAAFKLADPVPVPALMWASFAVGLSVGGGWGLLQRFTTGQKLRELQRKLARASATGSSDPWKS